MFSNFSLAFSFFLSLYSCGFEAKVDEPNTVAYLNWTPIFEWCVVRCGSKNRCQKDMFSKDVGLHAQNMINFLN